MAPDTLLLEGSALEIFPMNEAYSWNAIPFNDLGGTTVSNIPEICTLRSLHSKKKEKKNSNSDTKKDERISKNFATTVKMICYSLMAQLC